VCRQALTLMMPRCGYRQLGQVVYTVTQLHDTSLLITALAMAIYKHAALAAAAVPPCPASSLPSQAIGMCCCVLSPYKLCFLSSRRVLRYAVLSCRLRRLTSLCPSPAASMGAPWEPLR
jgi:hypothetical protein